ncbi:prestin-like [Ptychodera flava]|uniref:prestin-like n=1 Tax=Ptychodera flava TaxID=63121 RepID=UPI00396AB078
MMKNKDSDSIEGVRKRLVYHVSRPVYSENRFHEGYHRPARDQLTLLQHAQKYFRKQCLCSAQCLKNFALSKIPILDWLPKYQIREDLLGDVLAGFTVAVMNIPQSMAFSMLANVSPISGLCVSFFPVLVYAFFGTCRHMDFGTFGVASLMSGTAIIRVVRPPAEFPNITNSTGEDGMDDRYDYEQEKLLATSALTLMVGLIQIILYLLHMGFVTVYLSTPLVRGFTTGAACHIFTSQIKFLFGLSDYIPLYSGPLALVYTCVAVFKNLPNCNYVEVLLSLSCIAVLIFSNYFAERYRKKIRFQIPTDLLVVIVATGISYSMNLAENHGVGIAGDIPTGIPAPVIPPGKYMTAMIGDAFAIAIVIFSVSVSMADIWAKKYNYEVDSNQELLAYGLANSISSFFSCFASSCSLSRTLIKESSGGKTQMTEIVNCIGILIVILALGPLFESLPKAVLASIIMMALKGLFMQCKDLPVLWRSSRMDFWVWILTVTGTVLLGVDIGLAVGVASAIFMVILQSQRPNVSLAGNIESTDIYRDVKGYKSKEISGIKIISSDSTLYYVNSEFFKNRVNKLTGINPVTIYANQQKLQDSLRKREEKRRKKDRREKKSKSDEAGEEIVMDIMTDKSSYVELPHQGVGDLHTVIIDCGNFNFIDTNGVNTLTALAVDYHKIGVRVLLAACQGNVKMTLERCGYFEDVKKETGKIELSFLTVHDAILYAQANVQETNVQTNIRTDISTL